MPPPLTLAPSPRCPVHSRHRVIQTASALDHRDICHAFSEIGPNDPACATEFPARSQTHNASRAPVLPSAQDHHVCLNTSTSLLFKAPSRSPPLLLPDRSYRRCQDKSTGWWKDFPCLSQGAPLHIKGTYLDVTHSGQASSVDIKIVLFSLLSVSDSPVQWHRFGRPYYGCYPRTARI